MIIIIMTFRTSTIGIEWPDGQPPAAEGITDGPRRRGCAGWTLRVPFGRRRRRREEHVGFFSLPARSSVASSAPRASVSFVCSASPHVRCAVPFVPRVTSFFRRIPFAIGLRLCLLLFFSVWICAFNRLVDRSRSFLVRHNTRPTIFLTNY